MDEPRYIPCPKCGESMELRAGWCPMCRRPRSQAEIAEAVRKAEAPRKRYRESFSLLLLLAFGVGVFYGVNKVRVALRAGREARLAAEQAAAETAAKNADKFATARTKAAARAAQAKAEAPWTVEGRVYDLVSLAPVAGARLTFRDRTSQGKAVEAATGKDGSYRASLPPLAEGGYQLSVRHPVYGDRFLEDSGPAFSGQTREARLAALPLFDDAKILHVPILLGAEETSLRHDLVMRRPRRP